MQDVGQRCWTALKSLQRLTQENPDMKAKVERCRSSDMDKFKCIGLTLRTEQNNKRSPVQRNETVEYITTKVKFSLRGSLACSCWTRNHSWPTKSSGTVARFGKRSGNRRWRHLTFIVRKWTGDEGRCEKNPPRFSTSTASALRKGPTRRRATWTR